MELTIAIYLFSKCLEVRHKVPPGLNVELIRI